MLFDRHTSAAPTGQPPPPTSLPPRITSSESWNVRWSKWLLFTFATTARFLDFFRVHVPFWDYRVEIKSQISPLAVNLAISFIITCPSDQTPLSSTFFFELVSKLTTRGPKRDFISALYFWSFTLYFFRIWIWQNRLPFDYWFTHQRNCWN